MSEKLLPGNTNILSCEGYQGVPEQIENRIFLRCLPVHHLRFKKEIEQVHCNYAVLIPFWSDIVFNYNYLFEGVINISE